jgi:paraquat-inducible protein B
MKPTNYWKLGLFVLLGIALAAVAVIYFGSEMWGRSAVDYHAYFDESVQGLDVGSLVRFRGVTVGQVSAIDVAPDGRHMDVTCSLRVSDLRRQHLATSTSGPAWLAEPPGLRAQLTIIGLTGEQILSLDFFDPASHPVDPLPFPTPERTIPSASSTFKELKDSAGQIGDRLTEAAQAARDVAEEARVVLGQIAAADVGARAARALKDADGLLATLRTIADRLAAEGTPETAAHAVSELDSSLGKLDVLLAQLGSDRGLVASAQRATDALGDLTKGKGGVGRDLDETLRQAHETLGSIRRLADDLERDPDMLLKGRERSRP